MNQLREADGAEFGDVSYAPGASFGPRVQRDYQLVVVYSGEALVLVDEAPLHVPAEHVTLLLPQRREWFGFAAKTATRHGWCALAPSLVPEEVQQQVIGLGRSIPLSSRMQRLFELGLAVPPRPSKLADPLLRSLGLTLLQAYILEATPAGTSNGTPASVEQARRYVETSFDQPLTLARLAEVAGVTQQHLTRLFRRHLQTTPMRFVWQFRVQRGVELLRETGLPIATIAERVGFQSPFHFSRLVRQHYQATPRALRAQAWRGAASDS